MKTKHLMLTMLASLAALVLPGCTDDEIDEPAATETEEEAGNAYLSLNVSVLDYNGTDSETTRSDYDGYNNGDMAYGAYSKTDASERQINVLTICVFRYNNTTSPSCGNTIMFARFQPDKLLSSSVKNNVGYNKYLIKLDFVPDFTNYRYWIMVLANNQMGEDYVVPTINQIFASWARYPLQGGSKSLDYLMPEGYWLIKGYERADNLFMSSATKCLLTKFKMTDYDNSSATVTLTSYPRADNYTPLVELTSDYVYNSLDDVLSDDAKALNIYLERSAAKFTVSQSQDVEKHNYWATSAEIGIDELNPVLKESYNQFWDDAPTFTTIHHLYKGGKIRLIAHSYYNMNSRSFPFHCWYGGSGAFWLGYDTSTGLGGLKPADMQQIYTNRTAFRIGYLYNNETSWILNWSYTPRYYQKTYYSKEGCVPYSRNYLKSISEKGVLNLAKKSGSVSQNYIYDSCFLHLLDWEKEAWHAYGEPCYVTENCMSYDGMYASQATGMLLCGVWKPEGEEFEGVDDEGRPRSVIYCGEHLYSDESFVKKIYALCQAKGIFNQGADFDDKKSNGEIDMSVWEKTLSKITSDKQNADWEDDGTATYKLALKPDYLPLKDILSDEYCEDGAEALGNWLNDTINGGMLRYEYGKCYYVVYPRHFSEKDTSGKTAYTSGDYTISQLGRFGVVRNHWYDLTVNSVRLPGKPYVPWDAVCNNFRDVQLDDYEHQNNITCTFQPPEWKKCTVVVNEE